MPLPLFSLAEIAGQIDQPFALVTLGLVGSIGVNVYVAQGQMDWHKHIDEDELFLVVDGGLRLETELGRTTLHPNELILVPKGIGHRSSSALRSTMLLFRDQLLADRKNGHRTYLVTDDREPLAKAHLDTFANAQTESYTPATAAVLEGYRLAAFLASGPAPSVLSPGTGTLLYVTSGALKVASAKGDLLLGQGQLTIVPPHQTYSLAADAPTLVVTFERD